jgi:hypothetical protein
MQILNDPEKNEEIRKQLYKLKALLSDNHPSVEMPKIVRHLLDTYG